MAHRARALLGGLGFRASAGRRRALIGGCAAERPERERPSGDRRGLENRIAEADRRPRAHRARRRPRRGPRPGRARRRSRALARDGRAREPWRVAHGDREEPGDRPAPPPEPRRAQARGDRGAGGGRDRRRGAGRRARRRHRGRPAPTRLHGLPSGALEGGPGRAHAASAGRPEHRRDRPRLPHAGGDRGAAHRPREAEPRRGARGIRGAPRRRAFGAPRLGARGDLPRLQRGIRRHGGRRSDAPGPLRGSAAPGPHPRGVDAERARGPRARRAHGDPGLALFRARRAVGGARAPSGTGPRSVGPRSHRPRPRGARARGEARRRRAWPVRPAGGDCRLSRACALGRGDRLAEDRRPFTRSSRGVCLRRSCSSTAPSPSAWRRAPPRRSRWSIL